jgi:hypothetical protein
MSRSKGFGNPLSRSLGKMIDKVVPEVFETAFDVASGPKKSRTGPPPSSSRSTDWATRAPGTPRSRKRR